MAFSWRRIRRNLRSQNRPRDRREDHPTIGRYEEAPVFHDLVLPFRLAAHDWTTLWGAAALGYLRIVDGLLDRGIAVDTRDEYGRTALFYAIDGRQDAIVDRLLERGATLDLRDHSGRGPLHVAIGMRDVDLTRRLLHAGADPNVGAGDGPTPLMDAVRRGEDGLVRLLLGSGASVDAADRYGHTILFFVPGAAAGRLLPPLLDAGADPRARARDGDTPLHRALRAGDDRLYRALMPGDDEIAWQDERGRFGETLLHAAVEGGQPALVRRLLAAGAAVDARNAFGHTPLLIALTQENLPVSTLLTRAGATVGFLEAIALGDVDRAQELVTSVGFDIDALIGGHETPLMGAAARGREDLVRLLLRRGAPVDTVSPSLGTALDVAVQTGQPAIARLLLEHGADPAKATRIGRTELNRLRRGDDDDNALPPLPPTDTVAPNADEIYAAACAGSDDDLRWLRLRGANLDTADESGRTALQRAAADGDAAAVRRLLAFGADAARSDADGATARDIARRLGRTEVLALLEE